MSDEGKTPPGALPPPPINRKAVLLAVFIAFGKGKFDAAGCRSLTDAPGGFLFGYDIGVISVRMDWKGEPRKLQTESLINRDVLLCLISYAASVNRTAREDLCYRVHGSR